MPRKRDDKRMNKQILCRLETKKLNSWTDAEHEKFLEGISAYG